MSLDGYKRHKSEHKALRHSIGGQRPASPRGYRYPLCSCGAGHGHPLDPPPPSGRPLARRRRHLRLGLHRLASSAASCCRPRKSNHTAAQQGSASCAWPAGVPQHPSLERPAAKVRPGHRPPVPSPVPCHAAPGRGEGRCHRAPSPLRDPRRSHPPAPAGSGGWGAQPCAVSPSAGGVAAVSREDRGRLASRRNNPGKEGSGVPPSESGDARWVRREGGEGRHPAAPCRLGWSVHLGWSGVDRPVPAGCLE